MFNESDHASDRGGIDRVALQLTKLLQRALVAHQGKPGPIGEVVEIATGYLENLVEGPIHPALAEQRQDEMVDDPFVEEITRDANAGRGQGLTAAAAARLCHANHGKVGRAAPEISDEQRRWTIKPRGEAESGTQWLVNIMELRTPLLKHQIVALSRQG